MKIKLLVRILLSSFILSTLTAVPSEINYQGLITDSDGDPIESATNSVAVNLYQVETGGTAEYTQSFTQVASDANGIYSIQIGGASLQSVLETNSELWLELIINEQTLSPRQEINSVPYAIVSKSTESIVPGSDADAAITSLQADVDQNETDADAAIAALQAVDASSARQFVVDFGFTDNQPNLSSVYIWLTLPDYSEYYSCEVGDTVLLTGQSDSLENGIYEITSVSGIYPSYKNVSLVRSTNYDTAEELNEGDLVLIEKGESNGLAFMLGAISETFVLGNDALTWYRCGINTNQDIDFTGTVSAQGLDVNTGAGSIIFDGMDNRISASFETRFEGYNVRFNNNDVRFSNNEVHFENYGGVDFDTNVQFGSTVTLQQAPTQDNEVANKLYVDTAVSTNTSAVAAETSARATAITALQTDVDQNESDADAAIAAEASTARAAEQANADAIFSNTTNTSNNTTNISNNTTDIATNTTNIITNTGNVTTNTNAITTNADAITAEVTRAEAAETALQTDIDQNESDADAAIAALQAVDASSARQFVVDFGFTENKTNLNSISLSYEELYDSNTGNYYSCEVGDTVLLTGQSVSSENGIYEITNALGPNWSKTISLARSSDYDSAEEFNEGDLVLIERGGATGLAFMLGAISETFVLGNDALTWYRCGINTNQDIEFTGIVTVGELRTDPQYPWETELRLGQSSNYFDVNNGTLEFRGSFGSRINFRDEIDIEFQNYGGVDFDTDVEFNSTVTVQAPTQDDEVANKAYVDSVVVPSGGLIAWPVASGIPTGWSDSGLSSPMTNYMWIRKD